MSRSRPMLLVLLVAGCGANEPTTAMTPAARQSILMSPSGPSGGRTTVGELLEPARAGTPAASPNPDAQREAR